MKVEFTKRENQDQIDKGAEIAKAIGQVREQAAREMTVIKEVALSQEEADCLLAYAAATNGAKDLASAYPGLPLTVDGVAAEAAK